MMMILNVLCCRIISAAAVCVTHDVESLVLQTLVSSLHGYSCKAVVSGLTTFVMTFLDLLCIFSDTFASANS